MAGGEFRAYANAYACSMLNSLGTLKMVQDVFKQGKGRKRQAYPSRLL